LSAEIKAFGGRKSCEFLDFDKNFVDWVGAGGYNLGLEIVMAGEG